jgi:hypothetical protein
MLEWVGNQIKWLLYNRVDVYGIDFIAGERLEGKVKV